MVANEETFDENSLSESNYKEQYKEMKRRLRLLIYENEIFQQTLKTTQRKLLKASRDKSVLLDRLIQYERIELSSSDDELTESSDDGDCIKPEPKKRKEAHTNNSAAGKQSVSPQTTVSNPVKKRKPSTPKVSKTTQMLLQPNEPHSDGILSTTESSSKTLVDTKSGNNHFGQHNLPTDMFNDNFSVKSESNSMYDMDTSPSNVAEDMVNVDSIGK